MSKKKLTLVLTALVLVLTMAIGGTLAYFTDTDNATNTFTVGDVEIELTEPEWGKAESHKLIPGTKLAKDPTVTNTGSEAAYVRVQYAIPAALVDPNSNSFNDMLHVNFKAASAAAGYWSWLDEYTTGNGWVSNGLDNNNTYKTKIDGEDYMVWVVTYRTALEAGKTTEHPAFFQVYLDQFVKATEEDGVVTYTKPSYSDKQNGTVNGTMSYTVPEDGVKLYVVAEAAQAEGFTDAYTALNTAFGAPGSYTVEWTDPVAAE